MQFSQSFLDEIKKFLCSLESPFQVVLKNSPTFYDRTYITKVMADESLSTIFLDTLYIIIKLRGKVVRGDILPAECYLSQGSRSLAPLIMSGS